MDNAALLAIGSALLGGFLVAIVNFLAGRRKAAAETRKIDAETESTREDTRRKRVEARRLRALDALDSIPDVSAAVGWVGRGSVPQNYKFGIDHQVAYQGSGSGFIWSRHQEKFEDDDFGTLMQMFKADNYRGARYHLSARIRTVEVESWAGLWMRVDGSADPEEALSFDNMHKRPIRGTLDWRLYDVVLDVPEEATHIAFGVLLNGPGQVWIDDVKFERVDESVELTAGRAPIYQEEPINLNFDM